MPDKDYEIAIVGGGPAGLSAGLYAARARRSTVLIERKGAGGQISTTDGVENYPGFPEGVDGFELGVKMHEQASKYGMVTEYVELNAIEREPGGRYLLHTSEGDIIATAVILTAGADYNHLGIPNEERLTGKGVSYCATCDGAFYKGHTIMVVGGGDAALEEADFLTRYAEKVYLVHRRNEFRASKIVQKRALANPKIVPVLDTVVDSIHGDAQGLMTHARIRNVKTGEVRDLVATGCFVFVGFTPNTGVIDGHFEHDSAGYILTDANMMTSIEGLFAAGDVRAQLTRQITTAVGDATTAAIAVEKYLTARRTGQPAPTPVPMLVRHR